MSASLHLRFLGEAAAFAAHVELFANRGHDVEVEGFDASPGGVDADVLVLQAGRATDDALEALQRLRAQGVRTPAVLIGRVAFADCGRAADLGVQDVVFDGRAGTAAVEAVERAADRDGTRGVEWRRSCTGVDGIPAVMRDFSAFLLRTGVAPGHRVRIGTAVAEVLDNAGRHGTTDGDARLALEATVIGARVEVAVEDPGARATVPSDVHAARDSQFGLGRARILSEGLSFGLGRTGTRVELAFELSPIRFEEETESLSEADYLDPEGARALVLALREGSPSLAGASPTLALTIGRLHMGLERPATTDDDDTAERRASVG